jgi:hypothetical protein
LTPKKKTFWRQRNKHIALAPKKKKHFGAREKTVLVPKKEHIDAKEKTFWSQRKKTFWRHYNDAAKFK